MRSCLGAVAEEPRGSAEPAELVAAGLQRGEPLADLVAAADWLRSSVSLAL